MTVSAGQPTGLSSGDTRFFRVAFLRCVMGLVAVFFSSAPMRAHRHVFVDGGIDLLLGKGAELEAKKVTWLYDEFETLYILSSYDLSLNDKGGLDEDVRQELVRQRSDWPDDFDGSAHLSVDSAGIGLAPPTNLDVHLVDGRLQVTFVRRLVNPMDLTRGDVEVAFYESTYFYALAITNQPMIYGGAGQCVAEVIHFNPDLDLSAYQTTLLELGREETPDQANVGALFADRIVLSCE